MNITKLDRNLGRQAAFRLLVGITFVALTFASESFAAGIVYDNAALGNDTGYPVIGPRPDNPNTYVAQQFLTQDWPTIEAASVVLHRIGSPSGMLHFDIWSDDNGEPGSQVARLGSVDVSSLAAEETTFSVDGLSLALSENTAYHLLVDPTEATIPDADNSFRIGVRTGSEGTFGAGRTRVLEPVGQSSDWLVFGDLIPGINYMRMSVSTVPEPSGVMMAFGGFVCIGLLGRKRA